MKKVLSCILFAFSVNVFAGIQVDSTRVIYNSGSKSASLSITNDSDDTYMVQTWLDTGDASQMPKNLPIVVTPPILKLAAKKDAILRFIYSGSGLPQDRESLLWVNVQEIPPTPKQDNVLQVAIRTRIKLFYRPEALKANLQQQAEALKWQRQGSSLVVTNNGPLYVTLGVLTLKSGGKSWKVNADMVKPQDSLKIALPQGAQSANSMSFSYINDYGGHTEIKNVALN
ncbi:Chaperone protein focC precursor [Serratia quinivorans]|uniref:fimbrial biogenesis chaperone n=1 Tax=Serratia quinivorans TaxID=137545 RepID=UPI00217B11BD|nr:molecular chaperone [Serratia quinivorans]CAI0926894.1 Chaperone protein focC precursor [Serratia quinivorans]CAI0944192.1 Chaperone protein focC precursor [Serratia quinivorans]CAI1733211.1 Chaperone protein focC precursor [Serratia quinivorans]CAI2094563.1 Chaperone protein focC precursor [Serratia quinivorans]CAI2459880.1 Chaperone protein focC precursor [Serratia quinivorans]